jgi:hypothetical protein
LPAESTARVDLQVRAACDVGIERRLRGVQCELPSDAATASGPARACGPARAAVSAGPWAERAGMKDRAETAGLTAGAALAASSAVLASAAGLTVLTSEVSKERTRQVEGPHLDVGSGGPAVP